jgi:hypothetical protein
MVDERVWREKDIRIARQSAIKDSVNLLDIAERLGLIQVKDLNELFKLNDKVSNELFDKIYKDMKV